MKKIFLVLVLVIAICRCAASDISRDSLVGMWRGEYRNSQNAVAIIGHSVFQQNGKFTGCCICIFSNQKTVPVAYSGEWALEGDYLITKIHSSSEPSLFANNLVRKTKILEVTKASYTFEAEDGKHITDFRVE